MALPDQGQLQQINQITEALSSSERLTLSYLCGSLDTDSSVARVREMLKAKVQCHRDAHLFLPGLLLQLGRLDILRSVYKVSRSDSERYTRVLPRFRVLMTDISEDLAMDDLDAIKFLLGGTIPREKTENAKNFLDVIIELEKLDLVSPGRVDLVEKCLLNIGRVDLSKKVAAYKMPVQPPDPSSSQQQIRQVPQRGVQSHHAARGNMASPAYRNPSSESSEESYKFTTNPRGLCVIIDCVGNDGEMLAETFKALRFSVSLYKWLSVSDILSTLAGIFRQRENHRGDGFVCCIISRGAPDCLLGTDTYGRGLPMAAIRRQFTAEACPFLAGKPKLFFIQRYSVPETAPRARMAHRDEDLETDGCDGLPAYDCVPTDADIFWSHCWTDERQLAREPHHSIYLKALTETLSKPQKRQTGVVDIHREVNRAIFEHNRRNPGADYHIDVKHTLRKKCLLSVN